MTRIKTRCSEGPGRTHLTRREFIKAAGMTAAGIAMAGVAKSALGAVGANDRIGVGIIGCGEIGQIHIKVMRGLEAGANVVPVAVCDVWEKRRLQAQTLAGLSDSKIYRDWRKLIEDKDVDAVFIATPEHWHADIAIEALEHGLHCYLEKPLDRHLDKALKLYDVTKRSKCVVQIGVPGCSDAKWAKAGELIRAGKIGKIVWSQGSFCLNSKEGEWNNPIDPDANESNLDWDAWLGSCPKRPFEPKRYFRWRKYWDYCAGIISDHFPHILCPLMIALGPEFPRRVACIGTRQINTDQEVADTNHALVEFPSGHTMIVTGSNASEQGLRDTIRGHEATLYLSASKIQVIPERPFADELELIDVDIPGPRGDHEDHQRSFFDCIRTGKTPNCPIDLAIKAQVIVSLAEMSYKQNKMMEFDPKTLQVLA